MYYNFPKRVGRDVIVLKANFIAPTNHDWLQMPEGVVYSANAFVTDGRINTISSTPCDISAVPLASFAIGNLRYANEDAVAKIAFVNPSTAAELGIYAQNRVTYFRYKINDTVIYQDDNVNVYPNGYRKSTLVASGTVPYGVRPKNLEIVVLPAHNVFCVIINDDVVYRKDLDSLAINWTGQWQFVADADVAMRGTSVTLRYDLNR